METVDPVKLALDYVLRIEDAVRECKVEVAGGGGEKEPGLVRRARDLPGLVASAGLVPALTFYMSKAGGRGRYEALARLLGGQGCGEDCCRVLRDEMGAGEGAGYAAMLAVAAAALKELGVVGSADGLAGLAGGLKGLLDRGYAEAAIAEKTLLEFLVEFKKLAEALLGGRGGEGE